MLELSIPVAPAVVSVSELNRLARELLERNLPLMWVRGELSNLKRYDSGHCYFTLKDEDAQVDCVIFRHRLQHLDWRPENGMQVEVRACPTLYEARGKFQLNVEAMRRSGAGALFEAYERLKNRLDKEGLFDPQRKRRLPAFPRRIGIVTSIQAAALRPGGAAEVQQPIDDAFAAMNLVVDDLEELVAVLRGDAAIGADILETQRQAFSTRSDGR